MCSDHFGYICIVNKKKFMATQVKVEVDIDDLPGLPKGKVTVTFDPSRTDYDQLLKDLVCQLKDEYATEMSTMDVPTKVTCRYHFHRMAASIIKTLKVETYQALY